MAITRAQKEEQVDQLVSAIETSQLTIAADYKGLTVAELEDLRSSLREQSGQFKVFKNTLIKVAEGKSAKLKALAAEPLTGPTALTFGFGDEVSVAQVLAKFAKAHPALELKGAVSAEGTFLSAEEVKQLASLPSKDQLRGQLVGTLAAPVSGFVRVLHANLSGLVNVLNNYKEAKA